MITDDEAGFAEFVAGRQAALSRTAYLLTGDHHLAQDLVQAALLQAARHWRRIHTSPEAYVRRAMYHQNISWWRRRKVVEAALVDHDSPTVAPDTDLRLSLDQALGHLTTKQRTVLVLRFYEDLTEAETARILDCTVGTVKSQSAKGLAKLRTDAALVDEGRGTR